MAKRFNFRLSGVFSFVGLVAIVTAIGIRIRSIEPFPTLEYVDMPGVEASKRSHRWYFSLSSEQIRRVSHKSSTSIDSYSAWTAFEVSPEHANVLIRELHENMANLSDNVRNGNVCEQRSRQIDEIPIESPTGEIPLWWSAPKLTGTATENMLWNHDPSFGGTPQGCYTVYEQRRQTLWVYEFAAQGSRELWDRGSESLVR